MRTPHRNAFTLIELLVVIAVIVLLAALTMPLIGEMFRRGDEMRCMNNLKQLGTYILSEALKQGSYPTGGTSPGEWTATAGLARGALKSTSILQCPAAKTGPVTDPKRWASASYAYMGNLSPTYVCKCSTCGTDPGKKIWTLYWAGVDYQGSHQQANDATFKSPMPLADNLVFKSASVDSAEPAIPTIPAHQDTDKFTTNDRPKYRTQRALREIPETPEDDKASLALVFDIVVLKQIPASAPIQTAHLYVTSANKASILYANHCHGSGALKGGWGINIFYTNGSVVWKDWSKLRFQVLVKSVTADGGANHYYFF